MTLGVPVSEGLLGQHEPWSSIPFQEIFSIIGPPHPHLTPASLRQPPRTGPLLRALILELGEASTDLHRLNVSI